jgi:hypothetical protein
MRCRVGLARQLGAREAQRLLFAKAVGVGGCLAGAPPPPLGFTFFDLLLNARFSVDEAFSGITHMAV